MIANLIFDRETQQALDAVVTDRAIWKARLEDWCSINTGSRNLEGLQAFLRKLEEAFRVLPGTCVRRPLQPEAIINAQGKEAEHALSDSLHVIVRPEAPIKLVLTGHYDTVFPAQSSFQTVREIEPGVVNGPGVADMKGGLWVMLEALKAFETLPCAAQIGYEVLLSPDEEIGSPGSAALLHEIGARSDVGLTYEPALADGSMSGGRKGSGNFSLTIHGKAAHVGRAHHEGRSAIAAAARFVAGLEALNGKTPGVTFNTGRVDGGGPNNVVPDLAIVRFNVRVPDAEAAAWAQCEVDALIGQHLSGAGIHAHLHGGFSRPPKPRTPAQELVFAQVAAAGKAVGLEIVYKDTGGVCEGNNLAASGCANVDTLGPRGGLIHSDQEFAILDSFSERIRLSLAILVGYATGQLDAKAPRRLLAQELGTNPCS
ncbi:hydrolase [Aquidulcibacter sp.]|uniref:hydrolase n=1 Tax=Aquidulcibacter sp. TaxID=2052990 RepID=UPI0025BBDC90|nr:hydrolase [Aquidulcibacter sp.]MCA3695728.1 hydrolase [Aquidulcibacter sp.]